VFIQSVFSNTSMVSAPLQRRKPGRRWVFRYAGGVSSDGGSAPEFIDRELAAS